MPRSIKDILDHADELANRFEDYVPSAADERDPKVYASLRDAALSRAVAEKDVYESVQEARAAGYSWSLIGTVLGTSGEAVRQRYGQESA